MSLSAQILGPATFFGTARRDLRTPSFVFSEMAAAFSREGVPKHTHTNAHFVLVVKGVYVTAAQPDEGLCGPSTLIFNPSGTTHRDRFRDQDGRFFTISVSPEVSAEIERTIHSPVAFTSGRIPTLVRKAYCEFQVLDHFSELVMEGLGLELAARLGLARSHSSPIPPPWLRRAKELIRDCCTDRVSITDIAREADVHPIHLARTFRQYFGYSPGEYLRRCRMERVLHLLVSSALPLADLSLRAGFADQSQLTNSFKQFTGITPGEFRRAFQNQRTKLG
jgi:AraC family transcriptional regulator